MNTTVVTTVTTDKKLMEIQRQARDIVQRALDFRVVSDTKYEEATKIISWLANVKKVVENKRKSYVQPLNNQVSLINSDFKNYLQPFIEAREIIDNKMLAYRDIQLQKQKEEEEKIRKEAEILAKKENVSVDEIMESVEVKEIPKIVGTATVIKKWTYEVEDPKKIPYEFWDKMFMRASEILMIPNEVMIGKLIQAGVRKIPGIKIYEKEIISTR